MKRREFVRSLAGTSLLSLSEHNGIAKGSIPLAVPGKPPYSIFLSAEASPSERWAADELQMHLERITGVRLRIESGDRAPASRRAIAVGRSALTEQCGIEPPAGESCVLRAAGETVIIAGGRQRGTMYGVSIFLEKLGCRWFTSDIARIPHLGALRLPEFNELHHPGFEYREVFFTEAQGREWSARNRLNGHFHQLDERVGGKVIYMPFAHSFYDLVPPDRYFESHPEFFALVSGTRRRENAQLCLTNAEVSRLAVRQAEQWLAEHPEVSIVSISQNDGGGWCECEPCRKVIQEEGGAVSGLALRFVNQVAERLASSHPGKIVDMLAYQNTADAPSMGRPLPNVQIRLCPIDACQSHSYRTCAFNQAFRERVEQWSRVAPRLHIWQYSVNFSHYLVPFPNYDALISDIPRFQRAGVSGMFIEGAVSEGGGGDDAELRSYLGARLLWKPDSDASAEIREFLDTVYGPAAPLLRRYFALRQHEVRRGQHIWIDQNLDAPYLTRDFLKHGRILLERAARKAGTKAARRRVDRHLLAIEYVETMRERRCVLQGLSYGPADPARVRIATQGLLKAAEAAGITHFREGYPIAQQARDWGDVGATHQAAILTAGAVKVAVIPELEGRIVTFGPANVLRVPDPGELGYPHAGGISISLSGPRAIEWRPESATADSVTLSGRSGPGLALLMHARIAEEALRIRVTVSNMADSPTSVAIFCRAEFALGHVRAPALRYRDQSGRERIWKNGGAILSEGELPQQEWVLASEDSELRIRNLFRAEEVARCSFNWSLRGAPGLNMTVGSPQVELVPGSQLSLTSEYDLA